MKNLFLLLVIFIPACFSPDDSGECRDGSYEYTIEQIADSGLTLKAPARNMFISFNRIDEIYKDVEACIGVTVYGPVINFVSFSEMGWGGSWGFMHGPTKNIYINTDETDMLRRNCISDEEVTKHEFVHYVLAMSGQNAGHGNEYFQICEAEGVNTCNGEPCR